MLRRRERERRGEGGKKRGRMVLMWDPKLQRRRQRESVILSSTGPDSTAGEGNRVAAPGTPGEGGVGGSCQGEKESQLAKPAGVPPPAGAPSPAGGPSPAGTMGPVTMLLICRQGWPPEASVGGYACMVQSCKARVYPMTSQVDPTLRPGGGGRSRGRRGCPGCTQRTPRAPCPQAGAPGKASTQQRNSREGKGGWLAHNQEVLPRGVYLRAEEVGVT